MTTLNSTAVHFRFRQWTLFLLTFVAALTFTLNVAAQTTTDPAAGVAAAESEWSLVHEHWYIIELNGDRAGWAMEKLETDGDHYRSTSQSLFSLGRGATQLTMESTTQWLEHAHGAPISVSLKQKQSTQETNSLWTFHDDSVTLEVQSGVNVRTSEVALPNEEWFAPYAGSKYLEARMEGGAEKYEINMIEPENGFQVTTMTGEKVGEETLEINGREIPVEVWRVMSSTMPIASLEKISTDGFTVASETDMGIGVLTAHISTREDALAEHDGPAPEMMVQTLLVPDRPIDDSLSTTKATFRLSLNNGESMPAIPSAGSQIAKPGLDGSVTITVDANTSSPMTDSEKADATVFTSPSTMIDADDPLVSKLAKKALRDVESDDPMVRAEALRQAVLLHITRKGMATAFASAGETARTKAGDCTEHAVLLAGMMRSAGIPARVATGLVYVEHFAGKDNVFGWHMWTQALINGRWVDFDATLPTRYTAAHILTNVATLADNEVNPEANAIIMMIGSLDVEVVDYEHGELRNDITGKPEGE